MLKVTVDAITENIVRLENTSGQTFEIERTLLPSSLKEGQVLFIKSNIEDAKSLLEISIDYDSEKETRERIQNKLEMLRKRG